MTTETECVRLGTVKLPRSIPALASSSNQFARQLLGKKPAETSVKLNKRTCESDNRAHYWTVFGDRGVEQPGSSSGS